MNNRKLFKVYTIGWIILMGIVIGFEQIEMTRNIFILRGVILLTFLIIMERIISKHMPNEDFNNISRPKIFGIIIVMEFFYMILRGMFPVGLIENELIFDLLLRYFYILIIFSIMIKSFKAKNIE